MVCCIPILLPVVTKEILKGIAIEGTYIEKRGLDLEEHTECLHYGADELF